MWKTIKKHGLPYPKTPVYLLQIGNNNCFIASYNEKKGKFETFLYDEIEIKDVLKYHDMIYPTYIN